MTSAPETWTPLSEYCASRGVSTQAARKAIAKGRIGSDAVRHNSSGFLVVLPSVADRYWDKAPVHRFKECGVCYVHGVAFSALTRLEEQIAELIAAGVAGGDVPQQIEDAFTSAIDWVCDASTSQCMCGKRRA